MQTIKKIRKNSSYSNLEFIDIEFVSGSEISIAIDKRTKKPYKITLYNCDSIEIGHSNKTKITLRNYSSKKKELL